MSKAERDPPTRVPAGTFWMGRNPNPRSQLPVLLLLPVAGERPLCLATAGTWPGPRDLFCYELPEWPEGVEPDEELPVSACWRQGQAVHLVLKRRRQRRSIFVWTKSRGRTLIFWRSRRSMQGARPGIRVPQARGLERSVTITVDRRERYAWRFADYEVETERRELPVGDYGVFHDGRLVAAIERKSVEDLAGSLTSGELALVLAELSALPRAMLVVEGRLSDLVKTTDRVRPGWLLNLVAALQVEFPRVTWCFAETGKLAQDLAYRWLAAALRRSVSAVREGTQLEAFPGSRVAETLSSWPGRETPSSPEEAALWPPPESPSRAEAPLDAAGRRAEALAAAREGKVWTTREYAEHFGVGPDAARADLKALVKAGELLAEGRTRSRRYRLRES